MESEATGKSKGMLVFIAAATAAPMGYLLSGPCAGGTCGGCPAPGACLLTVPLVVVGAVTFRSGRRIKTLVTERMKR